MTDRFNELGGNVLDVARNGKFMLFSLVTQGNRRVLYLLSCKHTLVNRIGAIYSIVDESDLILLFSQLVVLTPVIEVWL